ncbi:hypothetical protein C2G38_2252665 [Gigaspora rosea]|uniref:Uncharacterized protein n=1 Tax=Gigaspora rosea TaxID=44941 RepID=A0A397UF09_9GLOM|nr:hypothetical protein C2G38_2252665 [Gigaspora rosea]
MTFQNLLNYVFPNGPPSGKRFIIKSSLEIGGQLFLPDQIINQVFKEAYSHIWIDLEDVEEYCKAKCMIIQVFMFIITSLDLGILD